MADDDVDRERWLEGRRQGLGGSDVAALFGVSPWMTPYTLYMDKTGQLPSRPDDAVLRVGRDLEPLTRQMYVEDTGRTVLDRGGQHRHRHHEWMLGNLDGIVVAPDDHDGEGVYEGKTTNPYSRSDWEDGPPLYYLIQVAHYMEVFDLSWASIALLVLGHRDPLLWADVERDVEFGEMLIEVERKFWVEHVMEMVPPEIDGHHTTRRAIESMYQKCGAQDSVVHLGDEAIEWCREIEEIKASVDRQRQRIDELKNRVRAAMGTHSHAIMPDGTGWSWKNVDRRAHTVSASSYRQLRRCTSRQMDAVKRRASGVLGDG